MGLFDNPFGGSSYQVSNTYAGANAAIYQGLVDQQRNDPVNYALLYGSVSPSGVMGGVQATPEEKQAAAQQIRDAQQAQIDAANASNAIVPATPGPGPAPAPGPSPDVGGGDTGPPPPPAYSGPTARQELESLLPSGFENTLIPSSAASPYITQAQQAGRTSAQDFIENMFKRGTVGPTGRSAGLASLTEQDPGVTSKLTGIADVLLANKRSDLRGLANTGFTAAGDQTGEFFDPAPYQSQVQSDASRFLESFPQSYTSAVGDTGGLYDTSGLGATTGAVSGPRNVSYDPYAAEGGQLKTGLEEAPTPGQKKRSTAVF